LLGTLGGFVVAAHADSIEVLASFLKTTQSAQARFVQTVTTPARPARAARQKKSSGHFSFIRPEHFRFDYEKPVAQSIVADGHTLWVYDKDIAQVSSKPLTQALMNTPAAVIAGAQDLKALEKVFLLEAQPMEAGLEWVKLTPVQKEGPMQFLRIGMRASGAGVALASLEMTDAFNQQSVLVFEDFVFNPKGVGLESFVFKPPPGVEVIKGE
jgi:outer membrane lipoprotein carrier protein